jgi:hypothetical protein
MGAPKLTHLTFFSWNEVKSSVAEHAVSQDWQAWIKAELEVRLFYCACVSAFNQSALIKTELDGI